MEAPNPRKGWGHASTEEVPTGVEGARGPARARGACPGAWTVVERGRVADRAESRGQQGHVARLVQASRDRRGPPCGHDDGRGGGAQGVAPGGQGAQAGERDPARRVEFLRAGARPATAVVIEFIDTHKERFGVEPICVVLREQDCGIAPSSYYAAKTRPPSARSQRDHELSVEIRRVWKDRRRGRRLYGARKVWRQLQRDGIEVGRGRVERLMRADGLVGARRARRIW